MRPPRASNYKARGTYFKDSARFRRGTYFKDSRGTYFKVSGRGAKPLASFLQRSKPMRPKKGSRDNMIFGTVRPPISKVWPKQESAISERGEEGIVCWEYCALGVFQRPSGGFQKTILTAFRGLKLITPKIHAGYAVLSTCRALWLSCRAVLTWGWFSLQAVAVMTSPLKNLNRSLMNKTEKTALEDLADKLRNRPGVVAHVLKLVDEAWLF
jgi:hypothetical protein